MKCEYNNSCYETAQDGIYIEYSWNVENNLEAEFEISYTIEGEEHELNVCEGCKDDIEGNCEEYKDSEFHWEERIREPTKSYAGRRSVKGLYHIHKPWTTAEHDKWIRGWHKKYPHLCKGEKNTFPYKCTEKCYN